MRVKWRPSLALVIGLVLALVLCLPLAGIAAVQLLAPPMQTARAAVLVGLSVVAATAGLGWVLWRLLYRPIRALSARAEAVGRGRAGAEAPLRHYGTREMERTGRAVMEMSRILMGREAVLRSYADHATHELKAPLTVLRGAAELLDGDDIPPEERARLLARIDEAADRMTALLDAQRALARAQEPVMRGSTRVAPLMAGLSADHPEAEILLVADGMLPLTREALRLVLDHLIGNAVAHGAGEVRLTVGPEGLTVADDGPGVSAGNRSRIFDPFFTTRRADGGTGMGLPIVRRMLEAHGAEIMLREDGPGATFAIRF
ncbi:two-component sensor histidine kinase [Pseudoroseicyclus sp. CLL3-39]|uniref:histidine kinase n=1 Tax=Pseudoroseicyclus tamaricis TaxID=2705421 RepID=A0A6B2JU37_9RHOB|nr:two-component sensor histidine kinase [Pseudoroseicyclus tamaricis]